ncbi:MAG: sulfite exporter TauE/SafE family protein [Alphaproteobacteria bacterium]
MIDVLFPQGIDPFAGLPMAVIAMVVVIYFMAFILRGAIGFGSVTPTVLLTSWVLEPHHAVLLALTTTVAAQGQLLPEGFRNGDWKITWPILAAISITIVAGIFVFIRLNANWLTLIIGVVMCWTVFMEYRKLLERLGKYIDMRAPRNAFALASVSGLIAGTVGAGGMLFLAVYLKLACETAQKLRATALLVSGLFMIWRFLVALGAGLISSNLILEAILLLPAIYLGGWIGIKFFQSLTDERFFRLFQLFLMVMAVGLVAKGLLQIL